MTGAAFFDLDRTLLAGASGEAFSTALQTAGFTTRAIPGERLAYRLFSAISHNWRGKPLVSFEVIVSLIAATTTNNGLKVHSELDTSLYPPGVKVSDKDFAKVHLRRDQFHGEWNYVIRPRVV